MKLVFEQYHVRGIFAVLAIALFSIPPVTYATLDETWIERIDRGLIGGLEIFNAPGISVAIVKNGELVYAKGFGYANRREGTLASADTLYYIGSITKTFTATLAMILRDKGMLDLDEPVKNYLPGHVQVPLDPAGKNQITLRHLLSHIAGLPKDPPNRKNLLIEGPVDPEVWDVYNIADLYDALATTTLQSPVGEKWHYSNMGMGLAGHILELVAKKPYEGLLKELIFEPLGMKDTILTLNKNQEERLAAFYWHQEGNRTEQPRARFGEVAGMGGITSSVRDMVKYAVLQLKIKDGLGDPISLASLEEMRKPVIDTDKVLFGTKMSMGTGWWIRSSPTGEISFEHAGEVDGHTSAFWYSTKHKVAAVILCNTANLTTLMIQEWLIRILQDPTFEIGSAKH